MSHTCHDQRYGPRSDTLADAQEQVIFNSAILTYPTEDQIGRRSAPIYVPCNPVQCTPPREETPDPANWIWDHQRRSNSNQTPVTTLLPVPPSKTIQFKLCIGNPSSYRARFNSIQRNNSSMSSRKHHLSLEPHAVLICDLFTKRFNICILFLPHLYVNK